MLKLQTEADQLVQADVVFPPIFKGQFGDAELWLGCAELWLGCADWLYIASMAYFEPFQVW